MTAKRSLTLAALVTLISCSIPAEAQNRGGGSRGDRGSQAGGSSRGPSVTFRGNGGPRLSAGNGRHSGMLFGGGHRHRPRHYQFYNRYWYLPYWSSVGWWYGDPFWSGGYSTYGGPYGGARYGSGYSPRISGSFAAIDTDISPEEAEVVLDGVSLGTADDFDGRPDFLYLKPGSYRLEFRAAGYDTLGFDLKVRRGEQINLNKKLTRMAKGSRLDSSDLERKPMTQGRIFEPGGKPVTRRAERMDRRERTEVREVEVDEMDDEEGDDASETSRDRVGRFEAEPNPRRVEKMPPAASAGEKGRLRIQVFPDDAAIYLDDRLIGTAEDLLANTRGVRVELGKHTVTVTRPGYKTKTVDVEAVTGKAVDVVIALGLV